MAEAEPTDQEPDQEWVEQVVDQVVDQEWVTQVVEQYWSERETPPPPTKEEPTKPPGRVEAWLGKPSTEKMLGVVAAVLFVVAFVAAGLGGWKEAIRGLGVDNMGVAGVLAAIAAVLFVLARTGASLKAALAPTAAILGYAAATWLLLAGPTGLESNRARAIAFGCLSVGFLLVVAALLKQGAVGKCLSRETSSGSTVLMLWTAVVVYAIAFIAALAFLDNGVVDCVNDESTNCIDPAAWPDYLILLGVPGAAAALAKAEKKEGEAVELSDSTKSTNEISEVQYFVFNAIAMLVVIGGLWRDGRLGEVPDALLGLTSVSALTFVLVKRVPPSEKALDS